MSDSENDEYKWWEHAPEATLSPEIVFGFSIDLAPGSDAAESLSFREFFLGEIQPLTVRGFSNRYANYIDLESMSDHLASFSETLSRSQAIVEEKKLRRLSFWWTPAVIVNENERFLDFSSLRTLNSCESFLNQIVKKTGEGGVVGGSRADYNDFDYIEQCMLQIIGGALYYEDHWERGYVSDDRFEPDKVDQPWDYNCYKDPEFASFQGKAKTKLEQFLSVKEALIEALGDEVLTRKYFQFRAP